MAAFLIDTNVASEALRLRPDPNVVSWMHNQPDIFLHLSVISLGEIYKGFEVLPPSAKRSQLEEFATKHIPTQFGRRILPVTEAVAKRWGQLDAHRRKLGRPLDMPDGLIAATALEHNLTVVTRNTKDFSHLPGLQLLNPWE
jgi:predicted nucleic acid-binding protein